MNETVKDYCAKDNVEFTRRRPYRKNDQAWVEQKNGSIVRRIVGYRRFEGLEATKALAELYRDVRLYINFFQPSFKLAGKEREGSKVRKRYHKPATPYQRLVGDARVTELIRENLNRTYATLDPVRLLRNIREGQRRLVEIADKPGTPAGTPEAASLDQFLVGLRTAWEDGEVRPTAQPKSQKKRERRRPDPLIAVTPQLELWFKAEPWRTASEFLIKLQDEHPGQYPPSLTRTLQRRLKIWRAHHAHQMVSGAEELSEEELAISETL